MQGPQGLKGDTGATGPQGIQGAIGPQGNTALIKTSTEPAGVHCVGGGTKIEVGLDSNNNDTLELNEIDTTLTQYVCNANNSNSNNLTHSHVQYSNKEVLSNWVVPNNVYLIEISVASSKGGKGGNIIYSTNGNIYNGYAGGDPGYVTFIVNVTPGDTIDYYLGNDGLAGSNLSCGGTSCCGSQAGTGIDGEDTYVYLNNNLITTVKGGKGGSGRGNAGNSGCANLPQTGGQPGYLDTSNILDSGIFSFNSDNLFSLNSSTILIRY